MVDSMLRKRNSILQTLFKTFGLMILISTLYIV